MGVGDTKVIVIAEIGVNHNGSLETAKKLVDVSAIAGADYAKFQTFRSAALASKDAPVANYQRAAFEGANQQDLLAPLELSEADFLELREYCSARRIGFLTTAHDLESAAFVMNLKSDFIKVPSGDITNYPFLRVVGGQGTPILLSTGASSADEVEQALEVLQSAGAPRSDVTVLQCTTQYPAPPSEANLLAMVEMGQRWGVAVGFSDHTLGQDAAIAAVALGASVLEKHITLDRTMSGPDHAASLEPDEFSSLVVSIRRVEQSLGGHRKDVTVSESENRAIIRKSIIAAEPIEAGDLLNQHNLGVTRPGTGLSPMLWPDLLGKRAGRSYTRGEMIELP